MGPGDEPAAGTRTVKLALSPALRLAGDACLPQGPKATARGRVRRRAVYARTIVIGRRSCGRCQVNATASTPDLSAVVDRLPSEAAALPVIIARMRRPVRPGPQIATDHRRPSRRRIRRAGATGRGASRPQGAGRPGTASTLAGSPVLGQQITVAAETGSPAGSLAITGSDAERGPAGVPGADAHAWGSAARLAGVDLADLPMPRARSKGAGGPGRRRRQGPWPVRAPAAS